MNMDHDPWGASAHGSSGRYHKPKLARLAALCIRRRSPRKSTRRAWRLVASLDSLLLLASPLIRLVASDALENSLRRAAAAEWLNAARGDADLDVLVRELTEEYCPRSQHPEDFLRDVSVCAQEAVASNAAAVPFDEVVASWVSPDIVDVDKGVFADSPEFINSIVALLASTMSHLEYRELGKVSMGAIEHYDRANFRDYQKRINQILKSAARRLLLGLCSGEGSGPHYTVDIYVPVSVKTLHSEWWKGLREPVVGRYQRARKLFDKMNEASVSGRVDQDLALMSICGYSTRSTTKKKRRSEQHVSAGHSGFWIPVGTDWSFPGVPDAFQSGKVSSFAMADDGGVCFNLGGEMRDVPEQATQVWKSYIGQFSQAYGGCVAIPITIGNEDRKGSPEVIGVVSIAWRKSMGSLGQMGRSLHRSWVERAARGRMDRFVASYAIARIRHWACMQLNMPVPTVVKPEQMSAHDAVPITFDILDSMAYMD